MSDPAGQQPSPSPSRPDSEPEPLLTAEGLGAQGILEVADPLSLAQRDIKKDNPDIFEEKKQEN